MTDENESKRILQYQTLMDDTVNDIVKRIT